MEERAVRGIPWTLLSYATNKTLRVTSTIALARILGPGEFGLMALALLAMAGINVLSDLGLGGVLVLRQDLDRRAQGTVLTLMLLTGSVGTLIVLGLAPLAALAFDEPRLTAVVAALSCTVLVGVFAWFYATLIQRELAFRRGFVGSVLETIAYIAVTLSLGLLGAGVWSLVAGSIASSVVLLLSLFWLAPYRVRPTFDRRIAGELFAQGRGFMAQGGFAFLRENADYLVVGRALGSVALGLYSMAYRIGEIPYWAVANPIANVTFPGFAQMRHRGEDTARAFATTLRMVALVTCPLGVILSATAEPFTRVFLGERWLPMAGALAVLGIWGAVRTVEATTAGFLNSAGQASIVGRFSAITVLVLLPAVVLAGTLGGISAVGWAVLADATVSLVALTYFADRRAGVAIGLQWQALRPVALACPAAWLAATLIARALDGSAPLVALLAAAAAGIATYAVAISLAAAGALTDAAFHARRAFGRAPAAASRS